MTDRDDGEDRVEEPTRTSKQRLKDLPSTVGTFVGALAISVTLILFVFQSYQVSGQSMQQTFQDGDRLIVWKLPRTFANLTNHDYIPKRGDVVIFNGKDATGYGQAEKLIKRVMAVPGERVVVANNTITVYNDEHPEGFQPDKTLPYGSNITLPAEQTIDVTLKAGQIYVCGDNRTNSRDSRFFGPIDADQIIGKVLLRTLPLNDAALF